MSFKTREEGKYLRGFLKFDSHFSVDDIDIVDCRMSSEFMTAQQQKTGTVYRFIRVPELNQLNQNTNTVVLIKNPNQNDSSTIAKVQKHVQPAAPAKIVSTTVENTGGKKVKARVSLNGTKAHKKLNFSDCF